MKWLELEKLDDPFNDAINYKTRQEKEFFNKIFLKTSDLEDCLKPSIYYVIGEKGAGKTAYASYLDNNEINETKCKLSTMTESQYKRFIELKRNKKLEYSDYANIWRPMLLNMVSQALVEKSKGFLASVTGKFDWLEAQIDQFNSNALNPEVEVAFEMIQESKSGVKIGNDKVGSLSGEENIKSTDKTERIKHHLLEKEIGLKEAISDLKLSKNHILFIDGIDYRPEHVSYLDYLACVKGLGEAAWQLNTEFFGKIRDSKGRIKVVLLLRPDVFHSLNLYNSNSRLQDNALLLDWSTTEQDMRSSYLYEAAGKYFSSQQVEKASPVASADHYLNAKDDSFIFRRLLRWSFQKPRDILTFIKIAKSIYVKKMRRGNEDHFESDAIKHPIVTKLYSDYLLGEVKNYAAFYMQQDDFQIYIKFFQYLDGEAEFNFEKFSLAFDEFKKWANGEAIRALEYLRDAEALLQFFYDVNVIGYRENVGAGGDKFFHFAYRERTLANIAPKIKQSGILIINPGVSKSLDIGLRVINNSNFNNKTKKRAKKSLSKRPTLGKSVAGVFGGQPPTPRNRRRGNQENSGDASSSAERSTKPVAAKKIRTGSGR